MGRKKSATESGIGKEIENMIREEATEAVLDKLENEGLTVDELLASTDSGAPPKTDAVIDRLLAVFPSSEGYYGKLYRKTPTGKMEFMYHIDQLEEIEDPELLIADMIKERGWKGGDYQLKVMKRGEPGIRRSISWNIAKDEPGHAAGAPTSVENLQNMKEIISTVKDITGNNDQNNTEVIAGTFKAGMEAVKDMMPKTEPVASVDASEQLLKTITTLKELGIIKPEQKHEAPMDILKLVTLLKELNPPAAQTQAPDILSQLQMFKEMGLVKLPSTEPDDPISQLEKMKTLADTFSVFGKTSESPVIEAIKILGPTIPKMVENISLTIQKVIDARMSMSGIKPNPAITQPKPVPEIEQIQVQDPVKGDTMHPMIEELEKAISTNDKAYYAKLENLINIYIGTHVIPGLIDGTIPVETFVSEVQKMIPVLDYQTTYGYVSEFVREKQKEKSDSELIVICSSPTCNEEYVYTKNDDFSKDKCEICGGSLKLPEAVVTDNGGGA